MLFSYEALPSYMRVQLSEIKMTRKAQMSERQEQGPSSSTNVMDSND